MPATEQQEQDPLPIDGGKTGLPIFMVTMLRLARILVAKVPERTEITTRQLSRLMHRHHSKLSQTYTARDIVEHIWEYGNEMSGFGVEISWSEIMPRDGRKMAQYLFAIHRQYEPDRTTNG